MNPVQQQRPVRQNDLLYNGLLTAMVGLIVKAQTGAGLNPVEFLAVTPCRDGVNEPRPTTVERTARGDLAPRR